MVNLNHGGVESEPPKRGGLLWHGIGRQIGIVAISGLLLIIVGVILVYQQAEQRKNSEAVIGTIGRQRMLTQLLAKHALLVAAGDEQSRQHLTRHADEMLSVITTLLQGGEGTTVPSQEVMTHLKTMEGRWTEFVNTAGRLARLPTYDPQFQPSLKELLTNDELMLADWQAVIEEYTEYFTHQAKRIQLFNILIMAGALTGIIVLFLFGHFRLTRPLQRLANAAQQLPSRRVLDLDHGELERKDEIGLVAREFQLAITALTESEEKLNRALESAAEGITITDLQNNILQLNEAVVHLHGYQEPQELIGHSALELIAPSDRPRAIENAKRTLEGGRIGPVEYAFRRKDGSQFSAELSAAVIRDSSAHSVGFVAVTRDITERKQAEEQMRVSLREKEVLLREVHHRVKNNLQIIGSLLNLQASRMRDQESIKQFRVSEDRVRSMSLIHDLLYRSQDVGTIDFGAYIRQLAEHLVSSYAFSPVNLNVEIAEVSLPIDTAIPCGLIINELVANSLKYAFPEGSTGKISITMQPQDDGKLALVISDDGVGFPPELDFRKTTSLGMQLVISLTSQLGGSIDLNREKGTEWQILFPRS